MIIWLYGREPSLYVTTPLNLVASGIVVMEIKRLLCHVFSKDQVFKGLGTLWMEAPHSKSLPYHV